VQSGSIAAVTQEACRLSAQDTESRAHHDSCVCEILTLREANVIATNVLQLADC
jgi:hypothetical protein